MTAKYPNYPTNYQNDILSIQEKKDDPSNLCKTIYANKMCIRDSRIIMYNQ